MIYGIIAAGEGSRLLNDGYQGLKPMVPLNGEMMIDRLISIFLENKAESIHVIINEQSFELKNHLQSLRLPVPLNIICKNTVSSLHSFHELLQASPNIEEICLTTTDTIFDKKEFKQYIDSFTRKRDIDGLLAVTSFIDDESPLYVNFNASTKILEIVDETDLSKPNVSGGIYCLRKRALDLVYLAINQGQHRMRNFQRLLSENKLVLEAYSFSKIMDVDRVSDISKAEIFLSNVEK